MTDKLFRKYGDQLSFLESFTQTPLKELKKLSKILNRAETLDPEDFEKVNKKMKKVTRGLFWACRQAKKLEKNSEEIEREYGFENLNFEAKRLAFNLQEIYNKTKNIGKDIKTRFAVIIRKLNKVLKTKITKGEKQGRKAYDEAELESAKKDIIAFSKKISEISNNLESVVSLVLYFSKQYNKHPTYIKKMSELEI